MTTQQKNSLAVRIAIALATLLLIVVPSNNSHAQTSSQPILCVVFDSAGGSKMVSGPYATFEECQTQCTQAFQACRNGSKTEQSPQAQAAQRENPFTALVGLALQYVGYAVGFTLGNLSAIFAKLIAWAIDPATWGSYTHSKIVEFGQSLTMNLANLFLVVALMIIAIATILRLESYGMRKTLFRLIIIALLINFNLVLTGILIDAANILTTSFTRTLGPNYADQFAAGFGVIGKILSAPPSQNTVTGAFQGFGAGTVAVVASILFFLIFTMVATIVLGALFIMLIIRVAMLWILLILAPIAFVAAILPGTSTYFKEWWNHFINWNLFAPVMAFFIWLAFNSIDLITTYKNPPAVNNLSISGGPTLPQFIMQFVVFIVLLILGMMSAKRFGIIGADLGIKLATGATRLPERMAIRQSQNAVAGPGLIGRTARAVENVTAGRPIVGGIASLIGQARGKVGSRIEAQAKLLEGRSSKDLARMALARGLRSPENTLAIIDILDKRNDMDELEGRTPQERARNRESLERLLPLARVHGRQSKILNVLPSLEPSPPAGIGAGARTRRIAKDKIENIFESELAHEEIAINITGKQASRLLAEASTEKLNSLLHTLRGVTPGTPGAAPANALIDILTDSAQNPLVAQRFRGTRTAGLFV